MKCLVYKKGSTSKINLAPQAGYFAKGDGRAHPPQLRNASFVFRFFLGAGRFENKNSVKIVVFLR